MRNTGISRQCSDLKISSFHTRLTAKEDGNDVTDCIEEEELVPVSSTFVVLVQGSVRWIRCQV